jgi:hypothetical protein
MALFGLSLKRKTDKSVQKVESVIPPSTEDGSILSASSVYGLSLDLDGAIKDEAELIRRYRETSDYSDCASAIDDIINEMLTIDGDGQPLSLNLDSIKYSDSIKTKIKDEFNNVLTVLDFNDRGYDIIRQWYIDGKLHYHIINDKDKPKAGILDLRYIDPRRIKKIKEVTKVRDKNGIEINKEGDTYYLYNEKGFTGNTKSGVKLSEDSVVYISSGMLDSTTGLTRSYLHKCIKIVNQLRMTEDSLVIYRFTRAPERRIFYIDVGDLPKIKADQYVQDTMARFRNKIVYNSSNGEISSDNKSLSMLEDYFIPRRSNGRSTEITTLPGGTGLSDISDITYFQNKLYRALNVPITRLQPDSGFSIGRSQETSRDEIKFFKFITRLRSKFSGLFIQLLKIQCISKGIISLEDWDKIENQILVAFANDNHFAELKDSDILQGRLSTLQAIDPYVGKYYSVNWVRKHVLKQSDEDIELIDKENKENPVDGQSDEDQETDYSSDDDTTEDSTDEELPEQKIL